VLALIVVVGNIGVASGSDTTKASAKADTVTSKPAEQSRPSAAELATERAAAKAERAEARRQAVEAKDEAHRKAKRQPRALALLARGTCLTGEINSLAARGPADPLGACDTVVPKLRQRMAPVLHHRGQAGRLSPFSDRRVQPRCRD
jgi:hypothetical protein